MSSSVKVNLDKPLPTPDSNSIPKNDLIGFVRETFALEGDKIYDYYHNPTTGEWKKVAR